MTHGEYSKLKLPKDFEPKHYEGVPMQMGRVALDSDWNEQVEIFRTRMQRDARSVIGACGSPNYGFRIGYSIIIDSMEDVRQILPRTKEVADDPCVCPVGKWQIADKPIGASSRLYVDYFDKQERHGSLVVTNANTIEKHSRQPISLPAGTELSFYWYSTGPSTTDPYILIITREDGSEEALEVAQSGSDSKWKLERPGLEISKNINVVSFQFGKLTPGREYHFDALQLNFPKLDRVHDFLIQGGTGAGENSGRIYVHGIPVTKDKPYETYTNQKDYPQPPEIELNRYMYLVYLDVWHRHITYIDDENIREVALGGPDTCTRIKTIGQVKAIRMPYDIPDRSLINTLCSRFLNLPNIGGGTLRTVITPEELPDKPCEITPETGYVGWGNQLYRVEIHDPGQLDGATFRWSRDNASLVLALKSDAAVGANSVTVEELGMNERKRLCPGDIIEITDDLVELGDEDFDAHGIPAKRTSELRMIKEVDYDNGILYWENTADTDTPPLSGPLTQSYFTDYHAKVRKWDGADMVSSTEYDLGDGVKIQFGEGDGRPMRTGDYWTFTTRVNTREVQEMPHEPPHGPRHWYCKLAITRPIGGEESEAEIVDCRNIFDPLAELDGSSIAFDDGKCKLGAETVQEAIERLCAREAGSGLCTVTVTPYDSIKDAVDSLDHEGGCVCLLQGEHHVHEEIIIEGRKNIRFVGCGNATKLLGHANRLFNIIGSHNIRFEDFGGSVGQVESAIRIEESRGISIKNCTLLGASLEAGVVHAEYGRGVTIENSILAHRAGPSVVNINDSHSVDIKNCIIINAEETTYENMEEMSMGIIAHGEQISVDGCTIVARHGIYCEDDNTHIKLYGNSIAASIYGVIVTNATGLTAADNLIGPMKVSDIIYELRGMLDDPVIAPVVIDDAVYLILGYESQFISDNTEGLSLPFFAMLLVELGNARIVNNYLYGTVGIFGGMMQQIHIAANRINAELCGIFSYGIADACVDSNFINAGTQAILFTHHIEKCSIEGNYITTEKDGIAIGQFELYKLYLSRLMLSPGKILHVEPEIFHLTATDEGGYRSKYYDELIGRAESAEYRLRTIKIINNSLEVPETGIDLSVPENLIEQYKGEYQDISISNNSLDGCASCGISLGPPAEFAEKQAIGRRCSIERNFFNIGGIAISNRLFGATINENEISIADVEADLLDRMENVGKFKEIAETIRTEELAMVMEVINSVAHSSFTNSDAGEIRSVMDSLPEGIRARCRLLADYIEEGRNDAIANIILEIGNMVAAQVLSYAIEVFCGDNNVSHNTIMAKQAKGGILLGAYGAKIEDNRISGTLQYGIKMQTADYNSVIQNTCIDGNLIRIYTDQEQHGGIVVHEGNRVYNITLQQNTIEEDMVLLRISGTDARNNIIKVHDNKVNGGLFILDTEANLSEFFVEGEFVDGFVSNQEQEAEEFYSERNYMNENIDYIREQLPDDIKNSGISISISDNYLYAGIIHTGLGHAREILFSNNHLDYRVLTYVSLKSIISDNDAEHIAAFAVLGTITGNCTIHEILSSGPLFMRANNVHLLSP